MSQEAELYLTIFPEKIDHNEFVFCFFFTSELTWLLYSL